VVRRDEASRRHSVGDSAVNHCSPLLYTSCASLRNQRLATLAQQLVEAPFQGFVRPTTALCHSSRPTEVLDPPLQVPARWRIGQDVPNVADPVAQLYALEDRAECVSSGNVFFGRVRLATSPACRRFAMRPVTDVVVAEFIPTHTRNDRILAHVS
jgi:hypothetical protein